MPDSVNPSIQRSDLQQLAGANERTIRYLENLQRAIADSTPLSGEGPPNGSVKSNGSRMYIDLLASQLWINTAPEAGQNTGWVIS